MIPKNLPAWATSREQFGAHHNYPNIVDEVLWKGDTVTTWDEAYENYVRWYKIHYSKLGQALK